MEDYAYVSMPINEVMDNIEKYVIPENRKIIEYLWDKNILTTQTNNYDNDFSWISLGELSEENNRIFWDIANTVDGDELEVPKFTTYKAISIPILPGTKDTFEDFKPLVDLLKYQDVQKDGYMTIEEFYINYTDCYKIIDNPHNIKEPQYEDYDSISLYSKAYEEYLKLSTSKIKVVDEEKIIKPLEEYLKDYNLLEYYDNEDGKIFYNKRLYDGHMKYKNTKNEYKKIY